MLILDILRSKFSIFECSHFWYRSTWFSKPTINSLSVREGNPWHNPLLFWGIIPFQKSNVYGPMWLNASHVALICLLLSSGEGHWIEEETHMVN